MTAKMVAATPYTSFLMLPAVTGMRAFVTPAAAALIADQPRGH